MDKIMNNPGEWTIIDDQLICRFQDGVKAERDRVINIIENYLQRDLQDQHLVYVLLDIKQEIKSTN